MVKPWDTCRVDITTFILYLSLLNKAVVQLQHELIFKVSVANASPHWGEYMPSCTEQVLTCSASWQEIVCFEEQPLDEWPCRDCHRPWRWTQTKTANGLMPGHLVLPPALPSGAAWWTSSPFSTRIETSSTYMATGVAPGRSRLRHSIFTSAVITIEFKLIAPNPEREYACHWTVLITSVLPNEWAPLSPSWSSVGPKITTNWVRISAWAYMKGVSFLTSLHYLSRSGDLTYN